MIFVVFILLKKYKKYKKYNKYNIYLIIVLIIDLIIDMKIVTIQDGHKLLGDYVFGKDIEYMCYETYNLWYENYYSKHLDKFPNWQTLYNTFIDISNFIKRFDYFNCYVAIEDNHVIGFISLNFNDFTIYNNKKINDSSLWLTDLFVWKQYRNKGVAKLLVKYVYQITQQMDIQLHLACNYDMINFYTNLGWKIIYPENDNENDNKYWTYMITE